MGALSGSAATRTQAAIAAGCDIVLHCNGKLEEMREVAEHAPKLAGKALKRANAALAMRAEPEEFDRIEGRKTFASLIAGERPVYARRPPSKARRIAARPLGRNSRRRRT
jgi:beta-N-acetylhexosaminidase